MSKKKPVKEDKLEESKPAQSNGFSELKKALEEQQQKEQEKPVRRNYYLN